MEERKKRPYVRKDFRLLTPLEFTLLDDIDEQVAAIDILREDIKQNLRLSDVETAQESAALILHRIEPLRVAAQAAVDGIR